MSLTETQIQSLYQSNSDDPVFYLVTLPQYDAEGYRFVNNNQNILSSISGEEKTYYAANFNVTLAKRDSETINSASLSISNIDRIMSDIIQTIDSKLEVTIQVVLMSEPNVSIIGDNTYTLQNITFNATTLSGDLVDASHVEDVASTLFQTSTLFPGLFL